SGAGKLVGQVYLQAAVKKACGIEIVPELAKQAQVVAENLKNLSHKKQDIEFVLGDFFLHSWGETTVVFINSTCFTQKMLQLLGEKINTHVSIRMVLTLRPIPTLQDFKFRKAVSIECSWDSALCYVYER